MFHIEQQRIGRVAEDGLGCKVGAQLEEQISNVNRVITTAGRLQPAEQMLNMNLKLKEVLIEISIEMRSAACSVSSTEASTNGPGESVHT